MSALKPRQIQHYGWRPDTPDLRDRAAKVVAPLRISSLPPSVDLSAHAAMPPVYDQGQLGSCTANAIAGAFEYDLRRQQLADFAPSRLAIYYGERVIERTVKSDAGAEIRDGMKVISKQGAGPETLWPYVISRFTRAPSAAYLAAAKKHLCVSYERVDQTEVGIKRALAGGYPIVFGISVYDSFESDAVAKTGRVPMPKTSEKLLGGHAILMTGYVTSRVRFRNSWGKSWGLNGYATLPMDYVLSSELASDFWIVKIVE
jgi:C1A family cysteine protease